MASTLPPLTTTSSPKSNISKTLNDCCVMVLTLAAGYWLAIAPGVFGPLTWGLDDAAMYLRYVTHVREGHGLVWNIGEAPVYGLTSLLYFVWLLCAHTLTGWYGGSLLVGSSWGFGLCGLVLLALIARELSKGTRFEHSALLPTLAVVPVAFHPYYRQIAFNGMESTLAFCSNCLFAWMLIRWSGAITLPTLTVRSLLIGLSGYLTFAARPDSGIFAVFMPFLWLGALPSSSRLRALTLCYGTLGLLLIADTAFKIWLFGDPLPLSYYVKRNAVAAAFLVSEDSDARRFFLQFLLLAMPALCLGLWAQSRLKNLEHSLVYAFRWLPPVLLHAAFSLSTLQIMGYFGRIYFPELPFIICWMLQVLLASTRLPFAWHVNLRAGFLPAICALLIILAPYGIPSLPTLQIPTRALPLLGWHRASIALSRVLEETPPSLSLATTEHGYLGARFPERKIVDLSGLHQPSIARDGFKVSEVLQAQPDIIWLPPYHYQRMREELVSSTELRAQYCLMPEMFDFGIALKRSTPHYPLIMDTLRRVISRSYAVETMPREYSECGEE